MPFEISTTRCFSAAHQLRLYEDQLEPLHGHNWQVRVTVGASQLDRIGVVMDFHELEAAVDAVVGALHNRHLNELPAFVELNPSAENVALHIARSLQLPPSVVLHEVTVWKRRKTVQFIGPDPGQIYRTPAGGADQSSD